MCTLHLNKLKKITIKCHVGRNVKIKTFASVSQTGKKYLDLECLVFL